MSKNFKPGDLALIVGCFSSPVNIGKCVELVIAVQPGEMTKFNNETWFNDASEVSWIVHGEFLKTRKLNGSYTDSQFALTCGSYLMPLHGDFQPEQQMNKEAANG